jgi:hypothetical protein
MSDVLSNVGYLINHVLSNIDYMSYQIIGKKNVPDLWLSFSTHRVPALR